MASVNDDELKELKSVIKSFVIAADGRCTVRRLNMDYCEMEGTDIPFAKYGYRSLTAFLKSPIFQNEYYFGTDADGNEVMRPKMDKDTAHIQVLVREQKHTKPKSRSKKRPGVSAAGRKMGPSSFSFVPANPFRPRPTTNRTGFSINGRPVIARPPGVRPQQTTTQPNWSSLPANRPAAPQQASRPSVTPAAPTFNNKRVPILSPGQVLPNQISLSTELNRPKPAASAAASGRTVLFKNLASHSPQVKISTGPAQSFEAPVIRSLGKADTTSGIGDLAKVTSPVSKIDEIDRRQWLKMRILKTLFYMRKEAGLSGVSVIDLTAKFTILNRCLLVNEAKQVGSESVAHFIEQEFAEKDSTESCVSSSYTSADAANGQVVKLVADNTVLLQRKHLRLVIQRLFHLVQLGEASKDRAPGTENGNRTKNLPQLFVPEILVMKIRRAIGDPSKGQLAALLVRWFFSNHLPAASNDSTFTVDVKIRSFSQELAAFSDWTSDVTFGYNIFPSPNDLDLIRGFAEEELSDLNLLLNPADPASLKWIPIRICSLLAPSHMFVTRVSEQADINKLSSLLTSFYEAGQGKHADYLIPMEMLAVGQVVAAPYRSRLQSATRQVVNLSDQMKDLTITAFERQWTRVIVTRVVDEKIFVGHLIDMGCEMKFREARFLMRDQFLSPVNKFNKGFAVQCSVMSIIPPIGKYIEQSGDKTLDDETVNELVQKGFPNQSVDSVRDFSHRASLTAAFFKNKKERGSRYEALIADVSGEEDVYLSEKLDALGLAQQIDMQEAVSIIKGEVDYESFVRKKILYYKSS